MSAGILKYVIQLLNVSALTDKIPECFVSVCTQKVGTLDTINGRIYVNFVLKCPYDWLNHAVTKACFIFSSYQICQSCMYDHSAFMYCHAETHIHQKKRSLQEVRDL